MISVQALLPLFRELNDLKRIRVAGRDGSLAERLFLRSWSRLAAGEDLGVVAREETAGAVAAARLAGIDTDVLCDAGLPLSDCRAILQRSFDAVAAPLDPALAASLREILGTEKPQTEVTPPPFALLLAHQPRAGATRPGYARVVLEPTENHAEHCAVVAVNAVLAAPMYGADPSLAFLTGLSHHFHNAYLPDAGDAGDALLGEHWKPILETFRQRALAQLSLPLQSSAQEALDAVFRSDTSAGKTFQTADVLDRVLEMEWHARSAAFTLDVALHDMDIVHPGPVQAFQQEIVRAAGLLSPAIVIRPAGSDDLPDVMKIVQGTIGEMRVYGSDQWDESYPTAARFQADADAGTLFVAIADSQVCGFIVVDREEPDGYETLPWSSSEALVIHRFAVAPDKRGQKIASRLEEFACASARQAGVLYIKTDTNSANAGMQAFFLSQGYRKVGEVSFRGKDKPFFCYEKAL